MKELTPAQERVLGFIRQFIEQEGFPPTQSEIARALGYRSLNAAAQHLRLLEKKGALQVRSGRSRGISLTGEAEVPGLGIPVIGEVAAGSPIFAVENIEQRIQLPPALFQPAPDYLLRVRGDSMIEAGIRPHDLVGVRRQSEVQNGRIAVVRIDDAVTLKYWHRRGRSIELEPANARLKTLRFDADRHDIALEGLVVGLLRLDMNAGARSS